MANRYRHTPAAAAVDAHLSASGRTMAAVADAAGIRSNHLSMIRNGAVALPVGRCGPLARELGIEPSRMVSLCIESYGDHSMWKTIALAWATLGLQE